MKKKVLAIVMSLAMAVAFMPTFAFAAPNPGGPGDGLSEEEIIAEVDGKSADVLANLDVLNDFLIAQLASLDYAAALNATNDFFEAYGDYVGVALTAWYKLAEAGDDVEAKTEILEDLEDYIAGILEEFDAYQDAIAYLDMPEVKIALAGVYDALEALNELLENPETTEDAIAAAQAKVEEAMAALQEAIAEATIDEVFEYLEEAIAAARDFVENNPDLDDDTKAALQDAIDAAEAILAKAEEYADDPQSLVDDIATIIEREYQMLSEMWVTGQFDEILAEYGIDGEALRDLIEDVMAYAEGYLNGEGYRDLQDEVQTLKEDLFVAEEELLMAAVDLANFQNGYALSQTKVKLAKKATKAKKRKVTVKWAGLGEDMAVTKFQVSYKVGKKKAKVVDVANDQLSLKIKKKFKKGKKVTVKVRAVFEFDFDGQTYTFNSKWSKAKKVKVK